MSLVTGMKAEPSLLERVAVFVIACAIIIYSIAIVRDADLATVTEPGVRRLIRHAYAGI
jgi:hypothetical protein